MSWDPCIVSSEDPRGRVTTYGEVAKALRLRGEREPPATRWRACPTVAASPGTRRRRGREAADCRASRQPAAPALERKAWRLAAGESI